MVTVSWSIQLVHKTVEIHEYEKFLLKCHFFMGAFLEHYI